MRRGAAVVAAFLAGCAGGRPTDETAAEPVPSAPAGAPMFDASVLHEATLELDRPAWKALRDDGQAGVGVARGGDPHRLEHEERAVARGGDAAEAAIPVTPPLLRRGANALAPEGTVDGTEGTAPSLELSLVSSRPR